jgi:hypothetical protein
MAYLHKITFEHWKSSCSVDVKQEKSNIGKILMYVSHNI